MPPRNITVIRLCSVLTLQLCMLMLLIPSELESMLHSCGISRIRDDPVELALLMTLTATLE